MGLHHSRHSNTRQQQQSSLPRDSLSSCSSLPAGPPSVRPSETSLQTLGSPSVSALAPSPRVSTSYGPCSPSPSARSSAGEVCLRDEGNGSGKPLLKGKGKQTRSRRKSKRKGKVNKRLRKQRTFPMLKQRPPLQGGTDASRSCGPGSGDHNEWRGEEEEDEEREREREREGEKGAPRVRVTWSGETLETPRLAKCGPDAPKGPKPGRAKGKGKGKGNNGRATIGATVSASARPPLSLAKKRLSTAAGQVGGVEDSVCLVGSHVTMSQNSNSNSNSGTTTRTRSRTSSRSRSRSKSRGKLEQERSAELLTAYSESDGLRTLVGFWQERVVAMPDAEYLELALALFSNFFRREPQARKLFGTDGCRRGRKGVQQQALQFLGMVGWAIRAAAKGKSKKLLDKLRKLGNAHRRMGCEERHFRAMLAAFHDAFAEHFKAHYTVRVRFCMDQMFMAIADIMCQKDFSQKIRHEAFVLVNVMEFVTSLEDCLVHKHGYGYLESFMQQQFCVELLHFVRSYREFKAVTTPGHRNRVGRQIMRQFVLPSAPEEINVSYACKQELLAQWPCEAFHRWQFDNAGQEVMRLIRASVWGDFTRVVTDIAGCTDQFHRYLCSRRAPSAAPGSTRAGAAGGAASGGATPHLRRSFTARTAAEEEKQHSRSSLPPGRLHKFASIGTEDELPRSPRPHPHQAQRPSQVTMDELLALAFSPRRRESFRQEQNSAPQERSAPAPTPAPESARASLVGLPTARQLTPTGVVQGGVTDKEMAVDPSASRELDDEEIQMDSFVVCSSVDLGAAIDQPGEWYLRQSDDGAESASSGNSTPSPPVGVTPDPPSSSLQLDPTFRSISLAQSVTVLTPVS